MERDRGSAHANTRPDFFYGFDDRVVEIAFHEPPPVDSIPESLVQSIWGEGRYRRASLRTIDDQPVVVRQPGVHNRDAGPDFLQASIRVGEMEWTGDIEIHVTSGQWFEHQHHLDARYNSVVLHVTLHPDVWTGRLTRADGSIIPEIVLYPILESSLRTLLYRFYGARSNAIPCAGSWNEVPSNTKHSLFERMGAARLGGGLTTARRALSDDAVEQLLYERIFSALGYAKNAEPMSDLSQRLPLIDVARNVDPDDLEPLFLGTAGLLPTPSELLEADRATADRAMSYRHAFERLRYKHDIQPMARESWLFFRLRPANFPPLRIAQGVALVKPGGILHRSTLTRLRAACLSDRTVRELRSCFDVDLPDFWASHVRLEKKARLTSTGLGRQRIDTIIVNAVLPALAYIARRDDDPTLETAALGVMRQLPAETDAVTRLFSDLGSRPGDALESQGMHHLYRTHCMEAQCLSCDIGRSILRSSPSASP